MRAASYVQHVAALAAKQLEIEDLTLCEVESSLYRQLVQLNMGDEGQMRYELQGHRRSKRARAIVGRDEQGKILSWILLFPSDHGGRIAYFYTRPRCRRRGYGIQMAAYLRRRYRNVKVCPHDYISRNFFCQLSFAREPGYR